MSAPCVAVAAGRHAVRVATGLRGETARLVAELPPGTDPAAAAALVAGPDTAEVLLVHGPEPPPAGRLRPLPAAVAVTRGRSGVVLDAGRSGTVVTRVREGRIVGSRSIPIGGDRLDEAVQALLGDGATVDDARRVREELSLLPEAACHGRIVTADEVAAVVAPLLDELVAAGADVITGPGAVTLVGGLARAPLLAERLDRAGIVDPARVAVAPRPELAALLAATALALPAGSTPPAVAVADPPPGPSAPGWPRRLARPLAVAGLAGVLAAAAAAAVVPRSGAPAPVAVATPGAGVLVQYGYRLTVPAGWEHTGGLPERRRSLLTRVGTPEGTDLIAVERSPLGYDSAAEPDRARAELRTVYDTAVAAGSDLSGYGPARVGGRDVVAYRQREASGADVDWYVVPAGTSQLSVGCRHTPAAADAVRAACATVVGSVATA